MLNRFPKNLDFTYVLQGFFHPVSSKSDLKFKSVPETSKWTKNGPQDVAKSSQDDVKMDYVDPSCPPSSHPMCSKSDLKFKSVLETSK